MIPFHKKPSRPIAIAVLLIATTTSIWGDQTDLDEMTFMPPTVAPNTTGRQYNAPVRPYTTLPPVAQPPAKNTNTGQVNLGRTGVAATPKSTRNLPSTAATNRSSPPATRGQPTKPRASPIVQMSATGTTATDTGVATAAHTDPMQGVTPDGEDPILLNQRRKRSPLAVPLTTSPMNRGVAPGIRGTLLGLNGDSATERLIQMREMVADLERENEELRQQNTDLTARVKESHGQLVTGIREIQLARKELAAARSDLDRLRSESQNLRDKVRIAEREYSAVLQSMGPLLQQLLETEDASALPPNPAE